MPRPLLRRWTARLLWPFALVALLAPPALAGDGRLTVFAAASMKNALEEIATGFARDTGGEATLSFAGSSMLARQIQQGAPADLFISANPDWMDVLEADGILLADTRSDLVGNALVLVGYGGDLPPVEIGPSMDLAGMLGDGRLAMALVQAVPAGIYGKAALEALGLWSSVAPQVVQADNVRSALALVSLGEAPLGIVYATDAVADDNVSRLGTFPPDSHPPIVYPVALVADGDGALARPFLDYLRGPDARAALERQGFVVIGE